jgi:Fe-S-cluster-containing hydrogenase component 2
VVAGLPRPDDRDHQHGKAQVESPTKPSALAQVRDPGPPACRSRCAEACQGARLSTGRSLHVAGQVNASTDYTCSRCLARVGACPTGALTIGLAGPRVLPDVTTAGH